MKYTSEYLQMQKLAGIITEGEYREKVDEIESSPEEATEKAISLSNKLENTPELNKLASKIASDPKMVSQLEKAIKSAGVDFNLNEVEGDGLDMGDMKAMALTLAKKDKQMNEEEDKSGSIGAGMASFIGGGLLGSSFSSAIISAIPAVASVFAGPGMVGALAGVGLFLLAKKVYKMMKGSEKTTSKYSSQDVYDMENDPRNAHFYKKK